MSGRNRHARPHKRVMREASNVQGGHLGNQPRKSGPKLLFALIADQSLAAANDLVPEFMIKCPRLDTTRHR